MQQNQQNELASDEQNESTNISTSFSFVNAEKNILEFWKKNNIFKKSLEQTKNFPPYVFYDGPPFATGLPHHGHLVASTLKDIIPRYFTMQKRYVDRRFGWDCHGLPIEQEIDKKFEMSAADFVAQFGIKKYNDECRGIVSRFTKEWEKTISRLGRWVDFENDYKTMDLPFMESIWWVFKSCYDQGLIYKGNKIVPFSIALQTGLSNFEATSNYQNVQDPAITLKFKDQNEDVFYLAWTTTPWTLPSNLGLIVNSEMDYVYYLDEKQNKTFVLAQDCLKNFEKILNGKILKTVKGQTLVGKSYVPLFNYFEEQRSIGAFKIHADNYVTTGDGTGIVHAAPAFGEDDFRVMQSSGSKAFICPISLDGKFTEEVPDFKGILIKDADKLIIKNLKDRDLLLHQTTLVHSYPFCYRTDTPLIYRALPQWYLCVDKIKDKMLAANQKINWVPEHIKDGRFGKWLENARDWAIGRNRYWGTPLPIWFNEEANNYICIGSVAELENYSGRKITDLHRENVDDIIFTVPNVKGTYKRIPEVLDCWFESGSMPYAQIHYPFENKELFQNGFPAEYIAEGLDQTRGWFYTLTVLSAALFNDTAFKNVIVNGLVLAADGKKMSKRLKNYTAPDELMEKFGADALRLTLINSGLVRGEELRFTDEGVKDMVRRALLPWYNSFKFFFTYAALDKFVPPSKNDFLVGDNVLDQYIISKLNTLISKVNTEMNAYKLYNVIPALFEFIEDLTNWYIRLNRRRFWDNENGKDKIAAYQTLYHVLFELNILMAPFAPFLSEHLFQQLKTLGKGHSSAESVHLEWFPNADEKLINPVLETGVGLMQEIILLGRQKRIQKQLKVKTPLSTLTVIHENDQMLNEIRKVEQYIKIELNVKEVKYDQNEALYIKLYAKPNSPVLGKKLGGQFGKIKMMIEKLTSAELKLLEKNGKLKVDQYELELSDFLLFRESVGLEGVATNGKISINLDCTLNPQLINEGLAREVVNRIQKLRKDKNFNVSDRITVSFFATDPIINAINSNKNYIQNETLSTHIHLLSLAEMNKLGGTELEIDEEKIVLGLTKS